MSGTLQAGIEVRVTSGPQRGQTGVLDEARDWPVGRRYRVIDPERHRPPDAPCVVGWFTCEQLEAR